MSHPRVTMLLFHRYSMITACCHPRIESMLLAESIVEKKIKQSENKIIQPQHLGTDIYSLKVAAIFTMAW